MRVESVKYEKLVSLGNYENQKIGIVVVLEPDESPAEALRRAQAFVEKVLEPEPSEFEIRDAKKIVSNPDDYAPKRVREAQELLARSEGSEEIPF